MRQSRQPLPRPASDDGEEANGGGLFPPVTRHRSVLTGAAAPPTDSEPGTHGDSSRRKHTRHSVGANLSGTKFDIIHHAVERLGFAVCPEEDFSTPYLIWSDCGVPPERVSELRPHQRINHFPGMSEISRKDLLSRNMSRLGKLLSQEYNFAPRTWCLPGEYSQFQQHVRELRKSGKSRSFIYKPANGAMGHGIRIYKNGEQVPSSAETSAIVQEYIAKPLLIDGYKCDLRIYVLVTSCDPLRVYFYNDGLLRLSTEKYTDPQKCDSDTLYMHLTNYSINKHSENYEKGDDDSTGSKRSIRFLNEYLQKRDYDVPLMWRSIIDLLVKTMLAAQPHLLQSYRMCRPASPPGSDSVCFEILGFDVLLDHKLKPWLLEVNRSPSFGAEQPIDRRVKLGMLDEALRLLNIRASDRARHANAQKAQAQRRLMRGRSEQREVPANGEAGERRRHQQLLARRREELLAQLAWLRRESDREEHEIRTCRRFRRIFPGEDRVRHERYAGLLLAIFAAFMPGRAASTLKELEGQYSSERPRQEELLEQLARCDAQQAEARDEAERHRGGGGRQQQNQQHRRQRQQQPSSLSRSGGGGSDNFTDDDDDGDAVAAATEAAASALDDSVDGLEDAEADGSGDIGGRRPSTITATRLPVVSTTAGGGTQLTRRHTIVTDRGPRAAQADRPSATVAVDPYDAEQLNRQTLGLLNELCIRFPGKSTHQAEEVLVGLRHNWKFNKALVANYWLVKLDPDKRRKIVDIVRQNVLSTLRRCFRVPDLDEIRLSRLFNRVFARLLASNGQGLWATFGNFASWEAALLQLKEPPSLSEVSCCRRVVQLCQDCLLTVFLFSGQPASAIEAAAAAAAGASVSGLHRERPVLPIGSTPRASLR